MTGLIFFVRAVCANSGAKVRHGAELQLAQGGSFLATAWKDKCWSLRKEAPWRDTTAHSASHLHFACMLMPVDALFKSWLERLITSICYWRKVFAEDNNKKAIKASIQPSFQNCKICHPFRFFGLYLFSSSNFNIVNAVKPLVNGHLNFYYNFDAGEQNLIPHKVVLPFTTSNIVNHHSCDKLHLNSYKAL